MLSSSPPHPRFHNSGIPHVCLVLLLLSDESHVIRVKDKADVVKAPVAKDKDKADLVKDKPTNVVKDKADVVKAAVSKDKDKADVVKAPVAKDKEKVDVVKAPVAKDNDKDKAPTDVFVNDKASDDVVNEIQVCHKDIATRVRKFLKATSRSPDIVSMIEDGLHGRSVTWSKAGPNLLLDGGEDYGGCIGYHDGCICVLNQCFDFVHIIPLPNIIMFLFLLKLNESRDGNKTRTRWGPDPQTRIDWGIPELTGDVDGDGESPNYETGDGAGMGITEIPGPDNYKSRQYRPHLGPKVTETLRGSFNKFTWYKNEALYTRIAAYSDPTRPVLNVVSTSWRHPWDPTLGITLVRMSMMANATPIVTTVTKTTNKEKAPDAAPRVNIQDFCEEHYEDILPIIMEKARRDKRKEVQTRLNFRENSNKTRREREDSLNSRAEISPARFHPERSWTRGREIRDDRNLFSRLSHRRKSIHERLSDTYSPSTTKSGPSRTDSRDPLTTEVIPAVGNVPEWKIVPGALKNRMAIRTLREQKLNKDDLAEPWTCEDVDPFTPRIRNFKSSRKTRMPNNVKTYDGTGDQKDHLKIFKAAAQVERWTMPTWCHMFKSTLIGAARQKKYVKDPIEIHIIKQRDGETIEDFMERFKVETGRMKGAPECMRISRFMYGVKNPELTKRLNQHVPNTMEEMMTITTAFIRGEAAAASKKKGHSSWKSQDQSKRHAPERKSNFRGQSREGRGSSRFTPLTKTPKEILATKA
ncbi:hypothetical protein Tco_0726681 [Tanacetum coccineum]|uniref:Reverse transcriptase domain-containing protein n=1 Tax=Tanacetum coccineum TaxID=301880 RepID=A0ABQ4YGX4_9ASTR